MVSNVGKSVIVESLLDGRRMPVQSAHKVSSLEDISIYTYEDDVPLGEVFEKIYAKENGGKAIHHKATPEELRDYLGEVLPTFDEDRVYPSDLKKLFQWYNLLQEKGLLEAEDEGNTAETSVVEDAEVIVEEPAESVEPTEVENAEEGSAPDPDKTGPSEG